MYEVPRNINDDWFVIYATLSGRRNDTIGQATSAGEPWRPTYAVSNDLCRDHKLSFLSPRWVESKDISRSRDDWLTDWLTGWLTDWLTDCLIDWLPDWLIGWLTDWLTGWLADWLTGWLADWLADWLTDSLTNWLATGYWLLAFLCYCVDYFVIVDLFLGGEALKWYFLISQNQCAKKIQIIGKT